MDDMPGVPLHTTCGHDIQIRVKLNRKERTRLPNAESHLALLERIIKASSNEGDVVLDPFCGCATTCDRSGAVWIRQWIGIDLSALGSETGGAAGSERTRFDGRDTSALPEPTFRCARTVTRRRR